MQKVLQKSAQTAPLKKEMYISELIEYLRRINENRIIALGYYANSVRPEKWDSVTIIRMELQSISKMLNEVQQVKGILRLENDFLRIQPSATSKLKETYLKKVAMAMDSCRELINLQKQRN